MGRDQNQGEELLAGLDVGGTKTAILIVDRAMQVIGRGVAPTVVSGEQALVSGIYEAVIATLHDAGCDPARLQAVGVGVPGMVDTNSGLVRLAVNLNLTHYPLGDALSQRFGAPVALENDVRAAALGAFRWLNEPEQGDLQVQSMAYLSLGTGISAGVVLDSKLYRGFQGMAGEIGHVIFEDDGPLCGCGLHGCFESLASGPAIARQWAGDKGTTAAVFIAAEAGDNRAQQIVARAATAIARAIQMLFMSYDVERVVLGGGVMGAGAALTKPIEAALADMRRQSNLAAHMLAADKVLVAPRSADVACWGAVLLASSLVQQRGRPSLS